MEEEQRNQLNLIRDELDVLFHLTLNKRLRVKAGILLKTLDDHLERLEKYSPDKVNNFIGLYDKRINNLYNENYSG